MFWLFGVFRYLKLGPKQLFDTSLKSNSNVLVFELISICFISMKKAACSYDHLFLQYRWFLQNLGKDFIQTNMHATHTTVLTFLSVTIGCGSQHWQAVLSLVKIFAKRQNICRATLSQKARRKPDGTNFSL